MVQFFRKLNHSYFSSFVSIMPYQTMPYQTDTDYDLIDIFLAELMLIALIYLYVTIILFFLRFILIR
jgi:hypothetical protein